jgi:repressor LexA
MSTSVEYNTSAMENLTKRQAEAADALRKFILKHGYPPTVRELAGTLKIDVRAAFGHITALERKGIIWREKGKSRSISFTEGSGLPDAAELPVLGRVPAGGPLLVPENIIDTLAVSRGWFGRGEFFVVQVEGESMAGAHIASGDYAVVKAQSEADEGDIIVAVIDEEVTIKRYSKKNNRVRLLPENPAFSPIKVSGDFRIAGRVAGIIRKY